MLIAPSVGKFDRRFFCTYFSVFPVFYSLVAQLVEHVAVNRGVTGSNPVLGASSLEDTQLKIK